MSETPQGMPKWFNAKDELAQGIASGSFGVPGAPFLKVRDIAARCGISLVTAQKVVSLLKDDGLIVQRGKGYVLGSAAAAPSRVKRVGLLVTALENPFFSMLIKNIENSASRRGIELLIASSNYDLIRERSVLEMFKRSAVDGVLACPASEQSSAASFAALGLPCVLIGRRIDGYETDAVLVQNFSAGQSVARHLAGMGLKSFAYVGVKGFLQDPRFLGFQSGLREFSLEIPGASTLFAENGNLDAIIPEVERLLQSLRKPAGVFCFHDLLAARVIRAAAKLDLRIPDMLFVVGFDNLPIAAELSPSLSSVAYPIDQMAEAALAALVERIDGHCGRPVVSYLEPFLVARESSGGTSDFQLSIGEESMAFNLT